MHGCVRRGGDRVFSFDRSFSHTRTNSDTATGNQLYTRLPTGFFKLELLMVVLRFFLMCVCVWGGGGKVGLELGQSTQKPP